MIDLIRSAPYDAAFVAATLIYAVGTFLILRRAGRRDPALTEKILAFSREFDINHGKSRPSPAE